MANLFEIHPAALLLHAATLFGGSLAGIDRSCKGASDDHKSEESFHDLFLSNTGPAAFFKHFQGQACVETPSAARRFPSLKHPSCHLPLNVPEAFVKTPIPSGLPFKNAPS
jgi:hypothetical protein